MMVAVVVPAMMVVPVMPTVMVAAVMPTVFGPRRVSHRTAARSGRVDRRGQSPPFTGGGCPGGVQGVRVAPSLPVGSRERVPEDDARARVLEDFVAQLELVGRGRVAQPVPALLLAHRRRADSDGLTVAQVVAEREGLEDEGAALAGSVS